MPSAAWSFCCRCFVIVCRMVRRLAEWFDPFVLQRIARLEHGVVGYLTLTSSRRRLSRIAGVVLFAIMSVAMMGGNGCESCNQTPFNKSPDPSLPGSIVSGLLLGLGQLNSIGGSTRLRANFVGSDGSQTGTASFLGNFTGITQSSGNYFVMLRGSDCSLFEFVGASALTGSFSLTSSTPNYERTLHQLASLKTTADVYPHGCTDHSTSISSRVAVALARKAASPVVFATVEGNGPNNAVFVLSLNADLTSIKFAPLSGLATASSLITADLNGDGNGDLVVVNDYNASGPFVSVLLGNGDGTFSNAVNYPTAGNASVAATVADVNGDGKLDIVAVSDDQHISVLLGNGDGTFQSAQSFAAPALPGYTSSASTPILGLIGADLNGDGKQDIVCSNGLVLLGSATGTLAVVTTPAFPFFNASPGGFGPGMAAGDINNDGKLDLVLNTGSTISTWIGKGDGTFTQGASYASINNSAYVTVTDLDGDGNYDIFTGLAGNGIYTGDDSLNATAYVLMGNGDGTFVGAPQTQGAYNGANLGDVNGDGVPDLITNSANGTFTVQLGNGKGGFTTASTFTAPASFTLGGYTFSNAATSVASTYAVADVNGDGKADLVFVDSGLTAKGLGFPIIYPYPVLFVAISNGDGTFQTPVPYVFPQIAPASGFDNTLVVSGLQIADVNKDGKNDLVMTYNDQAGGTGVNPYLQGFVVLTGIGNGTFSTTPILTSTYSSTIAPTTAFVPQIVSTMDLNGDSKPDLIVNAGGTTIINFQLQTQLQTFIGNGDGTFKAPTTIAVGADAYGIPALGDFNKDGKLDLATLAETSAGQAELVIAAGNGDGTFATPTTLNLTGGDAIRNASLVAADFDGDGKIDLALLDPIDFSGVFYGKGDGTFTSVPATGYIVPKDLINLAAGGSTVAIDLNKDLKPDILAGSTVLINLYGAAPVIPATTTLALSASSTTIAGGGGVNFTATVTPAAGSTATPTGTVTFYNGNTILGTGTVSAGVATLATTALTTAGTDNISAQYGGDTNFSGSVSAAVSVTVTATAIGTVTVLGASATSAVSGTSITFTATVTPASGTTSPTGAVTFLDGTTTLGTGTLAGGVATYTTTTLSVASHSITASYGGASGFSGSTSPVATVTITAPVVGTTTALGASATSAVSGTSITFTATVTPASGTAVPTGTVTFLDGTTTLGTGTLAAGVATYTTSALSIAAHSITASYGGASGFSASTSAVTTVTITAPVVGTTTNIGASSTNAVFGTSITFTATVTPASGTTAPGGTVTFKDGTTTLGTGTLAAGVATYTTSTLAVGGHSITASYGGAATFSGSISATALSVTITAAPPPDFTLSLSAGSTTVAHGNPATTTITLTPSGGYTTSTAVTCTGAPANSLCVVTNPTITPIGAGAASTNVTLQTSITTGSLMMGRGGVYFAVLPVGMLVLLVRRRRLGGFVLAISVCLIAVGGCGGKANSSSGPTTVTTAPGSYSLTITGTSGSTVHSIPWTVVVQ